MKRMPISLDPVLQKKMEKIPNGEKATVVRMALRDFFKRHCTEDDIETAIYREECFECRQEWNPEEKSCETCEWRM